MINLHRKSQESHKKCRVLLIVLVSELSKVKTVNLKRKTGSFVPPAKWIYLRIAEELQLKIRKLWQSIGKSGDQRGRTS